MVSEEFLTKLLLLDSPFKTLPSPTAGPILVWAWVSSSLSSDFLLHITQPSHPLSNTKRTRVALLQKHFSPCLELAARNRFYCTLMFVTAAICPWPCKGHLSVAKYLEFPFRVQLRYSALLSGKFCCTVWQEKKYSNLIDRYLSSFLCYRLTYLISHAVYYFLFQFAIDLWWGSEIFSSVLRCLNTALHLSTSHQNFPLTTQKQYRVSKVEALELNKFKFYYFRFIA